VRRKASRKHTFFSLQKKTVQSLTARAIAPLNFTAFKPWDRERHGVQLAPATVVREVELEPRTPADERGGALGAGKNGG
jgi:hypothetical protein